MLGTTEKAPKTILTRNHPIEENETGMASFLCCEVVRHHFRDKMPQALLPGLRSRVQELWLWPAPPTLASFFQRETAASGCIPLWRLFRYREYLLLIPPFGCSVRSPPLERHRGHCHRRGRPTFPGLSSASRANPLSHGNRHFSAT